MDHEMIIYVAKLATLGFALLAVILLWMRKGIAMQFALALSALFAAAACLFAGHVGLMFGTLALYFILWLAQVMLFVNMMAKDQHRKEWMIYSSEYENIPADPNDFPWLDGKYYDDMARELESHGFGGIMDREFTPLSRAMPELRHFSRSLRNMENNISVGISQVKYVKPKNMLERGINVKTVEFTTELSDGTFFITANTLNTNPVRELEGITMDQFPSETPVEKLINHHKAKLDAIYRERNVHALEAQTESERQAFGARLFELYRKDRMKKGGFTPEEMERNARFAGLTNDEGAQAFYNAYRQAADQAKK